MPAHWMAPGGRTKTPPVTVCFDTETASADRGGDEVLTLRCWAAIVRLRGDGIQSHLTAASRQGVAAGELADVLEAAVAAHGEAWCFAHNLGFDLTVTSLPMVLLERGWRTDFVSLGDESTVFVLERDRDRLVITDSWSWLRSPLRDAARDVGMRQGRRPGDRATLADWQRRCAHDVQILDRLLCELLDWWEQSQLGGFGVTGAACGWRTLRHHLPVKSVLVGADGDRTAFERSALYSGRKEVWMVGEVRGRWVADYDLVAAHLTIVANMALPTQPVRDRRIALIAEPLTPPEGLGTICEVEITTQTPCAPVKVDGDVWWPVGTFRTVLTSVELAEVVKVADRIDVLQAVWYRLTDALAPWGRWCLDLLDADRTDVPAVVRRVAKGWGRSVPGRFALRVSTLTGERPATHLGWALESGIDLDTGEAVEAVTYGGIERTYRKDQDGADVAPAVLAFIEGYLRAAMAQTLAARPPERLLQCNTDGWWEICGGGVERDASPTAPAPYTIVRRAHERGVNIIGPNHVETPGERRLSGVPKNAERDDAGGFVWQDWPGLRWQLEFSRPGEYVRPQRGLSLQPHYCRRWVLADGETVPASTTLGPQGATTLLPWSRTAHRQVGDVLADRQVPALDALRDGPAASPSGRPPGARRPYGRR